MRNKLILSVLAIAMVGVAAVFLVLRGSDAATDATGGETAVAAADSEAGAGGAAAQLASAEAEVVVYKSPTCGCCSGWVDHMRESGFDVRTVNIAEYEELQAKKRELGVPADLGSCHTAVVDGHVVEGHVPARLVRRMLEEEGVEGLAAPGMPIGSPGMEGPGATPYDVIAFGRTGGRRVYETVDPDASETR